MWCHNQPVHLFRQEDFLDTLKHRDTELQLAVKMLTYRFPPGQISADKNAALCLLSASCRKLVTDRIYDGKIRLSTLQTLCLLSMISFSEGYVMQAGLDLDMANYFANGLPLGSSLGDPFEYSPRIQAISLWNSSTTVQKGFSLPREPSMQTEPNDNQGILTYMSQAAKVWHLARAYAAMRIGPDSPPPWNPQSDYALVNLRNLELDCRFPLVYRFATNNFGEVPPEELQQRRDYWGPWIFIHFVEDSVLRTKAQRGYDKCMRFLDHMGSNWPVVFTMVSLRS
ncbi:hypothetical protein FOC4_g10005833 [Fusarium odoratissimum]|uniref:Transcription factor domain-containing protein n=1 Tax=Fusarium oxysporum f. sp. cubense (strain race 4) TaxID=2502994 RepID=N1RZQ3_FUSC4|nr:hypothetical protein FOC4_g10005833 [Fusarium odoratissimum]